MTLNHTQKTLIVTAVEAEKDAVLRGLQHDPRFDVYAAGVGPVAAAVHTMLKLAQSSDYGLVISMGIGGGFTNRAELESLVVSDLILAADLGSQTPDGFISMDKLGFGTTTITVDRHQATMIHEALREAGLPSHLGNVLTVSTATGTEARASELIERYPQAAAEAMEGFGIASAAHAYGLPVLEIRTISNAVGPRDRDAWRIKEAIQLLEKASTTLREVLG